MKTVEMELPGIPGKHKGIVLNLTTEREDWNTYVNTQNGVRIKVKRVLVRAVYFPDIKLPTGAPCVQLAFANDVVDAEFLDEQDEILRP